MMKLETGLKAAKELRKVGGETALALAIQDELLEYHRKFDELGFAEAQKKLTNKARVLLGLGFSEFLADEDNDAEYYRAGEKQRALHYVLGIDGKKLFEELERLWGRG